MIYKLNPTRVYRSYFGGYNLDRLENREEWEITRFPEDWLASVTTAFNPGRDEPNEGLSVTVNGEFLRDIIENNKQDMIGGRESMSLLFKLLDSSERLAIQVHPTVEFARENFGSPYGKTECWYILNDGGEVYIGFKEGITKEYWMELFESQDVSKMLDCLHKFDVKKGDFIFVAGGVPHAIGKNCFLAELQEPTDLMVIPEKVTPSGITLSEQKLHCGLGFERMFDCFVYDGHDENTTREMYFKSPKIKNDNELILVDSDITDKFRLVQVDVDGSYRFEHDSYCIGVVIDGEAEVNGMELRCGDRIFVSESERALNIYGNARLLFCQP